MSGQGRHVGNAPPAIVPINTDFKNRHMIELFAELSSSCKVRFAGVTRMAQIGDFWVVGGHHLSYLLHAMHADQPLGQYYRTRREGLDPADGNRWYLFIKELRAERGCSLEEAHRLAVADPTWRRWLEGRINHDSSCRKSALRYVRNNGEQSLLQLVGDRLKVR
jgi:hypothetical protein